MKISVITVCFNNGLTIADTIDSVACQTYPDIEHIVVDGASSDTTLEVLGRLRYHLAKFVSEPDHGIYDAMNKGIRLASGDVICFLNADDVYANSDVLSKIMKCIHENDLDAVFGDIEFFHGDNLSKVVRRYRSANFRPERIAWGWMPAHPSLFVRRNVFDQYGIFRTDYKIAGDFEFVARLFHKGGVKYHYLPEVLVRMRTGGISTGGWRNTLLLNKEVLRACHENGIKTNLLKILSKYPAKALEFIRR